MRYCEQQQDNIITLYDVKTGITLGYVEILEGGCNAVPFFGHKQTSSFSLLPCAKGYIAACFYNNRKRCASEKSGSKIIELSLRL